MAGGTLPERMFSRGFFSDLAQQMSADGVLVLNSFGRIDANLRALACALQVADSKHLRLFRQVAHTGTLSSAGRRGSEPTECHWPLFRLYTVAHSMQTISPSMPHTTRVICASFAGTQPARCCIVMSNGSVTTPLRHSG